jgi:hypothetical protein
MSRATNSWFGLAFDAFQLGLEAQTVIGLRLARIAQGDAAALAEANLMVAEKAQALAELQARVALSAIGGPQVTPRHTLAHYRRKVRANRRRLSR